MIYRNRLTIFVMIYIYAKQLIYVVYAEFVRVKVFLSVKDMSCFVEKIYSRERATIIVNGITFALSEPIIG